MDYLSDRSGRHIIRLNNLITVPDYVKSCSVDDDVIDTIPIHLFADTAHREFPIDDAGHTYLSLAYCKSAGINDPDLLQVIQSAGEVYGIGADLKALADAFDGEVKQAAAAQVRYAIHVDFGPGDEATENVYVKQGGVKGFYPISTPEQIEDSAHQLANDRERIPLPLFIEGCRNVIKTAKEIGVPLNYIPIKIQEYGEERLTDLEFVRSQCELRAQATGDEDYREFAKMAAEDIENVSMDDYAELLMKLDDRNGIEYKHTHFNPFQIFQSGPTKIAHTVELNKWTLINGAAVPVEAIAGLPETQIRGLFTKSQAEKILELVKSAKTLEAAYLTNEFAKIEKGCQIQLLKLLVA